MASPDRDIATTATGKGETAEDREKRRERLLAGRDSRLAQIVSSVGGSEYTPPPDTGRSPAPPKTGAPTAVAPSKPPKPQHQHQPESGQKSDSVREARARTVARPDAALTPPVGQPDVTVPLTAAGRSSSAMLKVALLSLLLLGMGYARYSLGRKCFASFFCGQATHAPGSECMGHAMTISRAVMATTLAVALPLVIKHVRTGNYVSAVSALAGNLVLAAFLLIVLSQLFSLF